MAYKDMKKAKAYQKKYAQEHKKETLERVKKYRQRHPDKVKETNNNWKKRNPEKNKKITTEWKKNNRTHLNEYELKYRKNKPEIMKKRNNRYYNKHKDECLKKGKEWKKQNIDKVRGYARKELARRRRELGYIPLNTHFIGSEGHHVSKDHVIYIPKILHKQYTHNHKIPKSMKVINNKAFMYLYNEMIS